VSGFLWTELLRLVDLRDGSASASAGYCRMPLLGGATRWLTDRRERIRLPSPIHLVAAAGHLMHTTDGGPTVVGIVRRRIDLL
jgi:hypothetical protein